MKNGLLLEASMVAFGGMVVPLMGSQPAQATTVFDVPAGQTSVVSSVLSSGHVSGVLVSGGGNVAFTTSNSYTGGTVIDGGSTLAIRQDDSLGYTTGTIQLGDSASSGALSFNGVSSGGSLVTSTQITSSIAESRGILINAGGGTIITNGGTVVSSGTTSVTSKYLVEEEGVISGVGQLTVTGGGTLELTGDNVWTGGTLVESGSTLEIGKQYNLGAATGVVTLDDGTLSFNLGRTISSPISLGSGGGTLDAQGRNDTISGVITGGGSLTIASTSGGTSVSGTSVTDPSSGIITLNQNETYTGGTIVEGGTLRLDSASLLGDVSVTSKYYTSTVLSGSGTSAITSTTTGTLDGVGSIAGTLTVANGGTVSPGLDGAGTLTVGSYVQSSTGTLTINVGSGGSSELAVTNNASLDGNLVLQYNGYAKAGTYQYLSVGGTTTGNFTSVTDDLIGAGMQSNVSGNSITLTQNSALPTGDLPTLIVAATNATVDDAQFFNRLVLDRLQSTRTTALAQREQVALSNYHQVRNLSPYGLWVAPLGGFGSASGNNGAPGYTTRRYGAAVGIDAVMAPGWVYGAAIDYTRQTLTQSGGGTATINTPRIQAYTGFWRGRYAIDLTVGDGSAKIHTKRSLAASITNILNGTSVTKSYSETASGTRNANELTAALQASGNYLLGYRWAVSPAAGVKFARVSETGLTESGTDYFNYRVDAQHVNSIRPFVNVQASRRFYFENGWALLPSATLGVEDEVGNRNRALQAQTYGDAYVWTVKGVNPASMSVDVDLGLAFETSKQQSFSIKFMGTESSGASDQTILGQYGLRF